MHFDGDAFISYAHLDNQELVEGHQGWVASLHRALEIRVGQLLGKPAQIWRDPKLAGNDLFAETLVDQLQRVAVLISVVSPRYVKSDWARKELAEFWKAAEQQGGVSVKDRARVFKVLKTPVELESTPSELRALLGYEFFSVDHDSGKVRELDEVFGPDAQREFWMKLDDLAHDIGDILRTLEGANLDDAPAERGMVFLAETSSDLKDEHQALRRDLQQHGYAVRPSQALPLVAQEIETMVREDLARCRMSIHLLGARYGVVPEGGEESVVAIQNEMAIERGTHGEFTRLVWIPPGVKIDDARQAKLIERVRMDPRIKQGDLLETYFEDLRTAVHDWLKRTEAPRPRAAAPAAATRPTAPVTEAAAPLVRLYLIHDLRDIETVTPWAQFFFEQHFEVIRPAFEGDEAEIREDHEENLRSCDAVVIAFGAANECWLRRKLRELQKSAGYGRAKPAAPVAIVLLPPKTVEKERLMTHEATLVPQWDGFAAEALMPFVDRLKGEGRQG